jgi:hypothetical protein
VLQAPPTAPLPEALDSSVRRTLDELRDPAAAARRQQSAWAALRAVDDRRAAELEAETQQLRARLAAACGDAEAARTRAAAMRTISREAQRRAEEERANAAFQARQAADAKSDAKMAWARVQEAYSNARAAWAETEEVRQEGKRMLTQAGAALSANRKAQLALQNRTEQNSYIMP